MRAGRKIHPVQLLKPTKTEAVRGEKKIIYPVKYDCFAGIEEIVNRSGNRKYNQDQDVVRGAVRIVIDFYPDFKSNWRIKDCQSSTIYEVLKLDNPNHRNLELILTCKTLEDV